MAGYGIALPLVAFLRLFLAESAVGFGPSSSLASSKDACLRCTVPLLLVMIESTDVKAPPTPAPTHMFIAAPTLATSTREPQDFSRLGMESDGKTIGDSASGMANPTTRDTTQGTRSLGKTVGQDGLDGTPAPPNFDGTRLSDTAADKDSAANPVTDSAPDVMHPEGADDPAPTPLRAL